MYEVQLTKEGLKDNVEVHETMETTFKFDFLEPGTEYYAKVLALGIGNSRGDSSDVLKEVTRKLQTVVVCIKIIMVKTPIEKHLFLNIVDVYHTYLKNMKTEGHH